MPSKAGTENFRHQFRDGGDLGYICRASQRRVGNIVFSLVLGLFPSFSAQIRIHLLGRVMEMMLGSFIYSLIKLGFSCMVQWYHCNGATM